VLEELDTDSALERLGGNQALYQRVLQSFLQDLARLPEQLDNCLASADLGGAARLLHTLKGLASTVGANPLAAVARKAELSVKDAQTQQLSLDAKALTGELRAAMDRAQAAMQLLAQPLATASGKNHIDAAPTDSLTPSSQAANISTLRELQTLLKTSNMHAIDVYDQWQRSCSLTDSPELQRLRQAMLSFDFEQAAQACQLLLDQIQTIINGQS
jgi:HPt (histidine-containing phosphotransfer) domain-containing protein